MVKQSYTFSLYCLSFNLLYGLKIPLIRIAMQAWKRNPMVQISVLYGFLPLKNEKHQHFSLVENLWEYLCGLL